MVVSDGGCGKKNFKLGLLFWPVEGARKKNEGLVASLGRKSEGPAEGGNSRLREEKKCQWWGAAALRKKWEMIGLGLLYFFRCCQNCPPLCVS